MIFQKKAGFLQVPVPKPERKKELRLFERIIKVKFAHQGLLNLAFTHRSFAHESAHTTANNERLEFLGDSILGAIVSEYLFTEFPDRTEGDLAKIKSFVVSEDSLAVIAKNLKVDTFLLIGKGEEFSGGRTKKAILADCLEAVIGACFLDSGLKKCRAFILSFMIPEINKVLENKHRRDFKTLLQEFVQKAFKTYPKYVLVQKTGPDHDKTFWVEVNAF